MFRYFGLARAAHRDRIDVLFSPMYLVSPFYRGQAVPMIQDISFEAHPEWVGLKTRLVFRNMARWSAKKAAAIIVPSEFTKHEVIRYYQIQPERITVAPLAADPIFSMPLAAEEAERVRSVYNLGGRFLLTPGTIFTRRHVPEIIAAVRALAKELPDVQYLITGRNATQPFVDISRRVDNVNAAAGRTVIVWRPYVPEKDLVALYHAATLTIYLSDYEGFGLPVIESLVCGTPVITNRATSLLEAGGEAAWYTDNPADPANIASTIRGALTNEALRQERLEQGRAYALKFGWQKTAQIIADVLNRTRNFKL
ncbi:glycosyltransferase family 4 protein [Candidatus Parcubacteria bacterium]|nr:glycosyltransferase family 4 protein [Candidatus Parcubacteria bacterium]